MVSSSYGAMFLSSRELLPRCVHSLAFHCKPKETAYLSAQELDFNCLFSLSWFMVLISSFLLAETQTGKSASLLSGYISLRMLQSFSPGILRNSSQNLSQCKLASCINHDRGLLIYISWLSGLCFLTFENIEGFFRDQKNYAWHLKLLTHKGDEKCLCLLLIPYCFKI